MLKQQAVLPLGGVLPIQVHNRRSNGHVRCSVKGVAHKSVCIARLSVSRPLIGETWQLSSTNGTATSEILKKHPKIRSFDLIIFHLG